jgi:phosphosulfolactate synthase
MRSAGGDDLAFPFVRMAPRPGKPRETGLTIVADRGMGLHRLNDLVDASGDHIDFFKIAIGAYRLQRVDFVRRKITALKEADIGVFFAGDVSEAAMMQGVAERFYRTVKELGADAVEVSSAQVIMSLQDKCALIRMAQEAGLKVVAEVGQKGFADWTRSQSYVLRQIEAYREAGAWKVLLQAEGLTEGVEANKWDLILNIAAKFDTDDLIFQAKDSASHEWYVTTFGNKVNLDIDDHQVIDVELMRRGLRKRHVFGLVGGLD